VPLIYLIMFISYHEYYSPCSAELVSTAYQPWNSVFLSQQISHSRLISQKTACRTEPLFVYIWWNFRMVNSLKFKMFKMCNYFRMERVFRRINNIGTKSCCRCLCLSCRVPCPCLHGIIYVGTVTVHGRSPDLFEGEIKILS
jgi:hypothetical protein